MPILFIGAHSYSDVHFLLTTQSLTSAALLLPLGNVVLHPPSARKPFLRFLGVLDRISVAFMLRFLVTRHAWKTARRETVASLLRTGTKMSVGFVFSDSIGFI